MIFQQLFEPRSSTFTYVLASGVGREALIIDPVYEHVDRYVDLCRHLDLRLVKAIDTHIHADHVTGLGALRDMTRCVTVMGERSGADVVSMRVHEGEVIDVDGVSMGVLYTPGHTDDSYSFVMSDRVFTGDALLIGGTGRTDFQNGDPLEAYDSLFNKLLQLPEETLVYPGHDYRGNTVSTIARERRENPRLQVNSAQEYADIMNNLDLPNPKMMDVAVPANRAVGLGPDAVPAARRVEPDAAIGRREHHVFVDLREPSERDRDGFIPGSLHAPYIHLADIARSNGVVAAALRDRPQDVVVYCAFGERSAVALDILKELGHLSVRHLPGGFPAWIQAGGPVDRG